LVFLALLPVPLSIPLEDIAILVGKDVVGTGRLWFFLNRLLFGHGSFGLAGTVGPDGRAFPGFAGTTNLPGFPGLPPHYLIIIAGPVVDIADQTRGRATGQTSGQGGIGFYSGPFTKTGTFSRARTVQPGPLGSLARGHRTDAHDVIVDIVDIVVAVASCTPVTAAGRAPIPWAMIIRAIVIPPVVCHRGG
jgi:hypothetical protein